MSEAIQPITFLVDGQPYQAFPGDTIAAALYRSGRRAWRRSRAGDARGLLCGMGTCYDCLLMVDGAADARACQVLVREGMVVRTEGETRGHGDAETRRQGDAGIRQGDAETRGAAQVEDLVAVVGGGPGGLSAALAASARLETRSGARVVLVDGYAAPGGQYYRQPPEWRAAQATPRQWEGRRLWQQVQAAGVEIRSATLAWNLEVGQEQSWLPKQPGQPGLIRQPELPREMVLSLSGPGGISELRARAVILATGTYERPAVFPGWTLPGVITAGAAQMLLYHGVPPGRRVLLAGTGPLQLLVAEHLIKAGIEVAAVLEGARVDRNVLPRAGGLWGQGQRIGEGLAALVALAGRRVPYRLGWGIVSAYGTENVEGASIARLDADWRPIPGTELEIACDTICSGYGFIPFNALAKLAGAQMEWRGALGGEVPARDAQMQTSIPGLFVVGDGAGLGGYRLALLEGQVAGLAAAENLTLLRDSVARPPSPWNGEGGSRNVFKSPSLFHGEGDLGGEVDPVESALRRERAFQRLYAALFTPGPGIYALARPDTLVCRCEGVTQQRLERAVESGAVTMAEVKALTRCGMGPCQGRMCGQHVLQTIARMTGRSPEEIGLNSARPPVFPLRLGEMGRG